MGMGEAADSLGLHGAADYTFTDQELTDILGYIETQQDLSPSLPSLLAPSGSYSALQFLPRSSIELEPSSNLSFPGASGHLSAATEVKSEPLVSNYRPEATTSLDARQSIPSPSYTARNARAGPASGLPTQRDEIPTGRRQSLKKGTQHRSGSGEFLRGHISHSTVEKQRRDRINALIDELRELVPAHSGEGSPLDGNTESKRPKHVVLSDTIALVKDLQIKVRDTPPQSRTVSGDCEEVHSLDAQDAKQLMKRVQSDNPPSSDRDSGQSGSPPELPELPQAPEAAPISSGVIVEQAKSCLYVKVNCRDRRGLLSDIILSLKSMPVEITTAAVTTTQQGNVYDVFQVKLDETSGITRDDVQRHVHQSLYGIPDEIGDKRRRTVEL